MSKPLHKLTSLEKLLRHDGGSLDPFGTTEQNRAADAERLAPPRIPSRRLNGLRSVSAGSTGVLSLRRDSDSYYNRQASLGAVWNIGGGVSHAGPTFAVPNGRGGMVGSGTNAPMFTTRFLDCSTPDQDLEKHERRLALALDFDQAGRVFDYSSPESAFRKSASGHSASRSLSMGSPSLRGHRGPCERRVIWRDNQWISEGSPTRASRKAMADKEKQRTVPSTPFRVLDAPQLRDDFYCSLLAYSATTHSLAVGLNDKVFIWSETLGVQPLTPMWSSLPYVTSLSFSSAEGGHSILAIGRADGHVALWSLFDEEARFEARQPTPVACLSFKPVVTPRISESRSFTNVIVRTEELLVGDEAGNVYYYSIEWADKSSGSWAGAMSLLARITVHTQQICGLAWSSNGEQFATGGNDNACCLFDVCAVVGSPPLSREQQQQPDVSDEQVYTDSTGVRRHRIIPGRGRTRAIEAGREKHRWTHGAAVKAIAFCPWQASLIASGGGSNDRCIHFYHTISGACLATINVAAQVTSLLWSTTRREIVATFGYAQPDHAYRIAVFSWPECRQIVAIPWLGEMRALYAIAYPGGPNQTASNRKTSNRGEGGTWTSRTTEEGCIVVAGSDESVKFHEVWTESKRGVGGAKGLLGGSDILEGLEGIDKEGIETIR